MLYAMSDPASVVQAVAEGGLLILGVVVFFRDGFQAKRANNRADAAELRMQRLESQVVELAVDREELVEEVAKIETPEQAAEVVEAARMLDHFDLWYENAAGRRLTSPEDLAQRREQAIRHGVATPTRTAEADALAAIRRVTSPEYAAELERDRAALTERYGPNARIIDVLAAERARKASEARSSWPTPGTSPTSKKQDS